MEWMKTIIGIGIRLWSAVSVSKAGFKSNELNIINSLGSEDPSVRTNAIHELPKLATQNPKESQKYLEVLCSHLRTQTNKAKYREEYRNNPSEEIKLLLALLTSEESKLREVCEKSNGEYILNFKGAFLNGADLQGAWLKDADLSEAQMQNAILKKAQLQGAKLVEVRMWDAQLQGAKMQAADMPGAQMQGSHLLGAQMQGADLMGAWMQGAKLWDVHMQGANLMGAKMQGANLNKAHLQVARMFGAELQGAILADVQLQGAILKEVNLCGARGYIDRTKEMLDEGSDKWKEHMESRRGEPTELTDEVIFSGGFNRYDKENIEKMIEECVAENPALAENLNPIKQELQELEIDTDPSYDIPEKVDHGVLSGDDVDKIIKECSAEDR